MDIQKLDFPIFTIESDELQEEIENALELKEEIEELKAEIDEKKNEYECMPYILGDFSINFDDKNSLEKFVEKNLKFNRKEVHVIDIITSNDMVKFELSDGSIAISDKKNSKYTFKVNGLNDFVVNLSHENDLIDIINIYIDMNNQGNF